MDRSGENRLTPRRISLLGVALAAGPILAVIQEGTGHPVDLLHLGVSQLVLISLVLTRVAQLAKAHAGAARRLEHLADHDPLTGVANRRAVDRHLEEIVGRVAAGQPLGIVVLFIDLNCFKPVNDGFGHRVGDELLAAVADRLSGCIRHGSGDLAGRLGGDEFILVLEGEPAIVGPAATTRVSGAFSAPFRLGAVTVPMSASVGTASDTAGR